MADHGDLLGVLGGEFLMRGYDLGAANSHAAARRMAAPMGYGSRWQWFVALLPRWDRRGW